MNKLSNYLVEQILLEDTNNPIKKTVVVYSGRFQPFHAGHNKNYEHLVKKFGKDNVFIGTSNKIEKPKSPFDFKDKVKIMTTMFGIPKKQIVEIRNPYKPTEILSKFDENSTAYITVVGSKDKNRLGGKYFEEYDGDPTIGYRDKGYVYILPTLSTLSGTDVRNNLAIGNEESKREFFSNTAYKKFNATIFKLVTDKLSESFVIEKETIEKWLLKETTRGTDGNADDGPLGFFPNMDVFHRVSVNRARKIGYEIIDMIMHKDLQDYYEHPTYPDGPVTAVSYYPAGVIGHTTPNNQVDIYSSDAYSEWFKHVTRKASLAGYELITTQLEKAMQKKLKSISGKMAQADKAIEKEFELFVNEAITIPVEIGDTLLMGKFKNKKVVVKTIGKDEHGMPTINGKKVVTFRLGQKGPNIFERIVELDEGKQVGILYHYTGYSQAIDIVKDNKLRSDIGGPLGKLDDPYYSISFTRDKNFHKAKRSLTHTGNQIPIRFKFDGNKISNSHRIVPFAQSGFEKNSKHFEAEEVIKSKKIFDIPLDKYLISMDILIELSDPGNSKYDFNWDLYGKSFIEIIKLAKSKGITVNMVDKNGESIPRKEKQTLLQKISNITDIVKKNLNIFEGIVELEEYTQKDILTEAKNKLKISIPSNVKKIVKAFKKNGKKVYIVGGAVRDAILGKSPKDFDLSTDAKAHEMVAICDKEGLKHNDKDIIYGTVIIEGEEVTQFRKDIGTNRKLDGIDYTDIEGDVRRRDLTINALFYDIDREEIVDLVGGIKDLQDKKIRTVGKAADRFEEDHLRKLRAIRFTVKIGGTMDPETLLAIKQDPTLKDVSANRIRMEFMKCIESAKSTKIYLDLMEKLKFLPLTFPGLKINKPYIDESDYIVLMAQLLKKNSKGTLESVLNKINYTKDEITDVTFLISLDKFTPDQIVDYKKEQNRTKLTDKQILQYGKHNNQDYSKFVKFKTSVKGGDAPKDVKGKEIGTWIQDEEKRRFLNEVKTPRIFYHGSSQKLNKFKLPIWVTTSPLLAQSFSVSMKFNPSTGKNSFSKLDGSEHGYVYKLEISNPDLVKKNGDEYILNGGNIKILDSEEIIVKKIPELGTNLRPISVKKWESHFKPKVTEMAKSELNAVEKFADKKLDPTDVTFSRHFFDRLNDPRNGKEITYSELISFFNRLTNDKTELTNFLKKYKELVITDKKTKINMPLVSKTNQIIAKTVMRKDNWKTSNPVYKFENVETNDELKSLKLQRLKLLNKAFKTFPNSPAQLKIRKDIEYLDKKISKINEYIDEDITEINAGVGKDILFLIKHQYFPIFPDIMDRIFGKITVKGIHVTDVDNYTTLSSIQGTNKTISTFTNTTMLSPMMQNKGLRTEGGVYVVVEGDLLLQSAKDLWSYIDVQGRKWVKYKEFFPEYGKYDIELKRNLENDPIYSKYKNKLVFDKQLTEDESTELIKNYINVLYQFMIKYKNEIQEKFQGDITRLEGDWNEVLINNFKIIDSLVLIKNETDDIDKYKNVISPDVQITHDINDIKNLIKKYGGIVTEYSLMEASFIPDVVKQPKVWYQLDTKDILKVGDDVVDLIQTAYKNTPLGSFVNSTGDLNKSQFWNAIDIDAGADADAVIFGRKSPNGIKIQGFGHDGERKSKDEIIKRLVKILNKSGYWVEASDALEHVLYKAGIPYVKSEKVAQSIFPNSELKMTGKKGQYTRKIQNGKTTTETIFGKPNTSVKESIEDIYDDINEILNSFDVTKKEKMITEGGAYGHMNHPFDTEINLTFGQLKDIVNRALDGNLEFTREKTDGQTLAISWKNGKLVAARNKGHLKNRGAAALDINGISSKFQGRGGLSDAYNFAMSDLSKAIGSLSDKQKEKIFKEGANFMNLEVIYPTSVNVIPYGQALLVFHGTMEYNEAGEAIGEDVSAGKMLAGIIKQVNQNVQDNYTIQGPPVIELPKNQDLSNKKSKYISKINKLQKEFNLKDTDGVADYHQAWWEQWVTKNSPTTLDNKTLMGLVKRWAFFDKSFRIDNKNIPDEKTLDWAKKHESDNHKKISKDNLMKFEDIFLGVGAEVLQFTTSVLTVNPDKALRDMKKRLEQTIKDVKKSGDEKNIEKLKLELRRLNSIGGADKIVPSEGIVFVYNGYTMKLTGTFASLNQLLGIFYS